MIDFDEHSVQIAAVAGVTVIGCVSLIANSEVGQILALAVAAALGAIITGLFRYGGGNGDAKEV